MGAFGISLIFSIGAAAWIYNQSQRRTGGLTQKSLTAAAVSGVVLFIFMFTILLAILPN